MKTSLFAGWMMALALLLLLALPAHADASRDMMNQSLDLVQQALNQGGPTPSDDERTDLLNKALTLAKGANADNYQWHRTKAIKAMQSALGQLKQGDPNGAATDDIRRAESELRTALSIAT